MPLIQAFRIERSALREVGAGQMLNICQTFKKKIYKKHSPTNVQIEFLSSLPVPQQIRYYHPMNTASVIESKVKQLQPIHLEVINESHKHNVPADSQTHFKLVIVSDSFLEQSLINRHRMVNRLLADELAGEIHALSLHTMTPTEWAKKKGTVAESPNCLGGDGKAGQ